jgi:hypothetical protein
LVLYLARQRSGLTLRQIGEALGGKEGGPFGGSQGRLEYKKAGKAVQRFEANLRDDRAKRLMVQECLHELSLVDCAEKPPTQRLARRLGAGGG